MKDDLEELQAVFQSAAKHFGDQAHRENRTEGRMRSKGKEEAMLMAVRIVSEMRRQREKEAA